MPEENFESENKALNSFSPKMAILLFVFIIIIVPFYESKRVVIWETQREAQKNSIFSLAVLAYAQAAENLKASAGLANFFEKEHSFWLELKKSPLINEKNSSVVIGKEKKEVNKENENNLPEENSKKISEEAGLALLPKMESPFKILIIGDSFIAIGGGAGNPLEETLLDYKDATILRSGKVSSGLSRPDYFNWNLKSGELISQFDPNVVIIMLGSNDAQWITSATGTMIVYYGNEGWNEEYAKRVSGLLDIFEENNTMIFWVGLPIMKKETFSNKMKNLNSIYEDAVKSRKNAYFIPTWDLLVDDKGNYTAYLPDKNGKNKLARMSDDIHLTFFGGRILAKEVIKKMEERVDIELKEVDIASK